MSRQTALCNFFQDYERWPESAYYGKGGRDHVYLGALLNESDSPLAGGAMPADYPRSIVLLRGSPASELVGEG